jgi:ergothioneine biosynthesis protein EgtB
MNALDRPLRPSASGGPANQGDDARAELRAHYRRVRDLTESLAAPLRPEDQVVQSMADVSPTKWHRGHTTWFFETFLLQPRLPGYDTYDPDFGYLFNSYYEAVGPRHPRAQRGLIARPDVEEVARYRVHVDSAMHDLIEGCDADAWPDLAALTVLGLHHEQQHEELLLMDIKHVLSSHLIDATYVDSPLRVATAPRSPGMLSVDGGLIETGHAAAPDRFAFDNESPRHKVYLEPFAIADRLVTAGEWLEFIDDGGYRRPELWLSDGWYAVQEHEWHAPLYWRADDDGWSVFTLGGWKPVDPREPVVHVSHYEADAFARWWGGRLPTEFEWEHAVVSLGAFDADAGLPFTAPYAARLHPAPAGDAAGLAQACGEVWQWTASAYLPYPRFTPAAGAVGEYNGKFMSGQMVLRGGACITPAGHARRTYRNFFPPASRWMFGGLRLATDA